MRALLIISVIAVWVFLIAQCASTEEALSDKKEFVGAGACISCHQQEYEDWRGSHHDWAMDIASEETVKGDFSGKTVKLDGVEYQFRRSGNDYIVDVTELDGSQQSHILQYTFGIEPLQQYITAFEDGKHQVLRVSWDTERKTWYHQYANTQIEPTDWLHWTRGGQNWNTMCAECHSTKVERNYDWAVDTFGTTWSEIDVSCESCHGPGSSHVRWAETGATGDRSYLLAGRQQQEQVDQCGACHARRTRMTMDLVHGMPFHEQYILQKATPEFYFADGQIREEDYVLGSFMQSKMYMNDVKCTDCHQPHSNALKLIGNALCMQCHEQKYDSEEHHFHPIGTASAECVNCHMTGRVYMGNDFRRDHSFRVPRPDQSVVFGTPNACTGCHTDQTDQWAADQVIDWYGDKRPVHPSDVMLISTLPELTSDQVNAILEFVNDRQWPDLTRATALSNLAPSFSEREMRGIVNATTDSSALVRREALLKFADFPPEQRYQVAEAHIRDSARMVRMAAAVLLADRDTSVLVLEDRTALRTLMGEYETMLYASADFPSGRIQIGDYHLRQGRTSMAIRSYEKAIEMDPELAIAYPNLATAYSIAGNNGAALRTLDKLLDMEPEYGRGYYLRGLLNYEMGEEQDAIEDFRLAIRTNPNDLRSMYNLATLYYQRKEYSEAADVAKYALAIAPDYGEMQYLLALVYKEQGRIAESDAIMRSLQQGR